MEIKYKFANGEESYVEVSEEIGAAILESRRKEGNLNKKEYRHSAYSIDALIYEGEELADRDTPESVMMEREEVDLINTFAKLLTETQKRYLKMRLDGMSITEIAKKENKSYMTIKDSLSCVQKKFKTFFKKTP
jgi:DNA-directed RNA polymerase specialized sigma24 family protein